MFGGVFTDPLFPTGVIPVPFDLAFVDIASVFLSSLRATTEPDTGIVYPVLTRNILTPFTDRHHATTCYHASEGLVKQPVHATTGFYGLPCVK